MKQYLLTFYCRPKNDAKIIINYPNVGALTSAMLEYIGAETDRRQQGTNTL